MATNALKTSVDPLATILQDTPEDVALNKKIQESIESKAGLEVAKEKEQATQKSMEAKGQENVQKEYARKVEEDPLRAEKLGLIEKQKDTTFVPTKENVNDLAAVFTLTNLLGFMIGGKSKGNAQAALSAQNGMLEGHQKGLQDVYKREKDIFDENQKALEKTINALDKQLTENIQLYATDRDAGLAAIRTTLAEHNAKFLQDSLEKYGPAYMYDQLMNTKKVNDQLKEKKAKLYEHAEKTRMEEERLNMERARLNKEGQGTLVPVTVKDENGKDKLAFYNNRTGAYVEADSRFAGATKFGGGGKGTGLGAINSRFAINQVEGMTQAAADIANVARANKDTMLGTFAGMTGKSGENLISALQNTFARNVTNVDTRAYQQLITGLELNMARALGGGYANSTSKNAIETYKQQIPQEGDDPRNAAMFLARVRQEFEILNDNLKTYPGATEGMLKNADKAMETVRKSVPFTVEDVQSAIEKSKASTSSGPQEGDKNKSKSGRPIIYKNGAWHYEDER